MTSEEEVAVAALRSGKIYRLSLGCYINSIESGWLCEPAWAGIGEGVTSVDPITAIIGALMTEPEGWKPHGMD